MIPAPDAHEARQRLVEAIFLPVADIHKAAGIVNHIKNSWWSVHPEKGLMFFPYNYKKSKNLADAAPQCNTNEEIARRLNANLWPETEVRFFESVLQPINPRDYA
jgi:hypothetical protein